MKHACIGRDQMERRFLKGSVAAQHHSGGGSFLEGAPGYELNGQVCLKGTKRGKLRMCRPVPADWYGYAPNDAWPFTHVCRPRDGGVLLPTSTPAGLRTGSHLVLLVFRWSSAGLVLETPSGTAKHENLLSLPSDIPRQHIIHQHSKYLKRHVEDPSLVVVTIQYSGQP